MEDDCPPGERPEGLTILTPERLEMVCKLLAFIGGRITDLSQVLLSNRQLEEQRAHFLHFMQRQHQLEEALRDAELKALQSQVNPHFMFNALNVIARLALLQKDFQTERVVGALARLMRYSLYQVKVMVTVREEVKAVQDYLLIQKARFQGRIDSSVEVDEKVLEAKMPCMILQPLVENACLHGLEPLKQGGTIKVRGWMENSQVCFQIEDNGVGMSEQLKKDIFHMQVKSDSRGQVSGLGLANVLRRMQYQFGSSCALDINSSPGKGTCLKLSFPYQTGEGASD
ncbi:MAG: sensor histidine kinase, partial [Clostridia bacterium]|nr:sensor histidine kinase [Clostridia bacterium]